MKIFAPLNSEPKPVLQMIEVATFFQLPSFQIIGLPNPEVAEAKERVRSAIEASGIEFPRRRVILNLSPASIRKRGTGLDLAIALAILGHGKKRLDNVILGAWGELGLDGTVKSVGQVTRSLYAAWGGALPLFIVSREEYPSAVKALQLIEQSGVFTGPPPRVLPVSSLAEAWEEIYGRKKKAPGQEVQFQEAETQENRSFVPPSRTQSRSKMNLLPLGSALERVIGVAVSGKHHLLLLGPRGTGKTQALEWVVSLQRPLHAHDRLAHQLMAELLPSCLNQLGAQFDQFGDESQQKEGESASPIRRVSSHVRPAALTGGVSKEGIRPGEFSLAHGGVLIADELPEWARDSRESLREPLESGRVTLSRSSLVSAHGAFELPAGFLLAANGNLCPCGGWPKHFPLSSVGDGVEEEDFLGENASRSLWCKCSEISRSTYLTRLSGPVLDRIDLSFILVQRPQLRGVNAEQATLQFERIYEKTHQVHDELVKQWGKPSGKLSGVEVEGVLHENPQFLEYISQLECPSLRSRHKLVRLALTLSMWDGHAMPEAVHFSEAAMYRSE